MKNLSFGKKNWYCVSTNIPRNYKVEEKVEGLAEKYFLIYIFAKSWGMAHMKVKISPNKLG